MRFLKYILILPCLLFAKLEVSFLIADLKVTKEREVKICEIQQGTLSNFKGYAAAYPDEEPIFKKAVHQLLACKLPIIAIRKDFCDKQIAHLLDLLGEKVIDSVHILFNDNEFNSSFPKMQALFIGRKNSWRTLVEQMGKPPFTVLDERFFPSQNDKLTMNALFNTSDVLRAYKPAWISSEKIYTETLAQEIREALPSSAYVLKPLGYSKGRGVIIAAADDLDETLRFILIPSHALNSHPDPSFNAWGSDKSRLFIIEEFISSFPVFFDQKPYDGTLREVFIVKKTQGLIKIDFLGSYWKLPIKALNEPGTVTEMHKSDSRSSHFLQVDLDTETIVRESLKEVMVEIFRDDL